MHGVCVFAVAVVCVVRVVFVSHCCFYFVRSLFENVF